MIDSGSSKFIRTRTGTWVNINSIDCFYIRVRNLDYDGDEPRKYCIVAKGFLPTNGYHTDELEIKPHQVDWTEEEWQAYLDEFMYDQGLCNGKE